MAFPSFPLLGVNLSFARTLRISILQAERLNGAIKLRHG